VLQRRSRHSAGPERGHVRFSRPQARARDGRIGRDDAVELQRQRQISHRVDFRLRQVRGYLHEQRNPAVAHHAIELFAHSREQRAELIGRLQQPQPGRVRRTHVYDEIVRQRRKLSRTGHVVTNGIGVGRKLVLANIDSDDHVPTTRQSRNGCLGTAVVEPQPID
jgi:hypothetical protein